MSYQNDKQRFDLNGLIPNMLPITKAPAYGDIVNMQAESAIDYLAVDAGGTLYAVQNPALMTCQAEKKASFVIRRVPRRIGKYSEYDKNRG